MKIRWTMALALTLLLALAGGGYYWYAVRWSPARYAGQRVKIAIGVNNSELSTLVWIANDKGYFREHGLEATVTGYQSGIYAMEALLAGQVDLAAFSDFVFVQKLLSGKENLRILAVIAETLNQEVVVRQDRGILRPGDLKGKKVAVAQGTSGEFFLGVFLTLHGLSLEDLEVIDTKPVDMEAALTAGQVDAVVTWEPYLFAIKTHLGEQVKGWRDQSSRYFWLLGTTSEVIKAQGEALGRVFGALAQAEAFVKQQERQAKDMMRRRLGFGEPYAEHSWAQGKYALSLDQGLLLHLEDQARWLRPRHLSGPREIPNFLDYLNVEELQRAAPQAVKIIVPGGRN